MRKSCPKCNSRRVIKHGNRRRKCASCQCTFRVSKRGSKTEKISKMYLLDRSTYRRIGQKEKRSHVSMINSLQNELKHFETPIEHLKKIYISVVTFWLSTANTLPLGGGNIVNI